MLYYFIISQEDAPKRFVVESNYPKRVIECQPENESDIEEYLPREVDSDDARVDQISRKHVDDWRPVGPSDLPSFRDVGLIHSEMLFVIDMDS